MEAKRLQLKFLQRLQNHLTYPIDMRTIDIQYYLTVGQDRYIENMYNRFKGEEALRKRLAGVYIDRVLDTSFVVAGTPFRGGQLWHLPEDVRYVLDEYVKLSGSDKFIPVKPVDASYINKQENNPFKKPYTKLVWRLDRGYHTEGIDVTLLHELVTPPNSGAINSYGVVYIKSPAPVELTSTDPAKLHGFEVTVEYHDEILDLAVEFALQTLALSGRVVSDEEINNPK